MNEYMIYPKQFKDAKITIEKNKCFVIMPFTEDLNCIYGEIKASLNDYSFTCSRADEIAGSHAIMNKILTEMLKSQYIIADLTHLNPNVFYELGIAHTFKNSSNILVIKQKNEETPFDIRHLTYIEYSPNNIHKLTSMIKKFIDDNKVNSDFYDALNEKGIINSLHDNQDEFVTYLESSIGDKLFYVTQILNNNIDKISEEDIKKTLDKIVNILESILKSNNHQVVNGILDIYYELIISLGYFTFIDAYIFKFLNNDFDEFKVEPLTVVTWKTDLAIRLAKKEIKLEIVMPWLIEYFSKSKSATIDLNRYNIECFFMTTKSDAVNTLLANAIRHENNYVREHISDIIGEKRLEVASDILSVQLITENNFYTATSIISAIGKLGRYSDIVYINNWLMSHDEEIRTTKQFFVVKHAGIAINKLDNTPNRLEYYKFTEKYKEILEEYNIF